MKSIYISSTEPRSGKSVVAIGLMKLIHQRIDRIGFIKPIGNAIGVEPDDDVELVRILFKLNQDPDIINPVSIEEAREILADGGDDELLTRILRAYNKMAKDSDIVVIEGTDYTGAITALELDINADISKTLDAPVLMVASGENRNSEEIISQVSAAKESFDEKGCDFIGVIVTKVAPKDIKRCNVTLPIEFKKHNIPLLGIIPSDKILSSPRMGEIARKLGAKVMFGKDYLTNLVSSPRIAAMTVGNALARLEEGMLLITPGDREDMLVSAMVSRVAVTYPNISGIILTGGFDPSDSVKRLIGGLSGFNIPILQMEDDTMGVAIKVSQMPVSLYARDTEKIEIVYKSIRNHVKRDDVYRLLELKRTPKTTPLVFLNQLLERAKSNRKRIVLPEGNEERTLKAVSRVLSDKIADIILIGNEDEILEAANRANAKIEDATIVNPTKNDYLDRYTEAYFELRKHKGLTPEQARDLITDPIYFGTMMVQTGDADGLVSGAVHTTRHTITPAFQIIKTRPDTSLVSSVFFMCLPDRVLVYGDCAVNPDPNAEQLADIAISSAGTAKSFGFDPLVAMLSYSTGASGVGPEVEKIKEATRLVMEKAPDLNVDGPLQYDAAISIETARAKLPDSKVAGRANIFIFPDLNAGNTAYKAVQRSAKAIAIGPVLQGLNKPVNDLSRGCKVEDIVYTIVITAIQAQ
ncbi:MAG: phosphate acetyltransferase [Candidatus Hatepunaea meridiana]|nr:phosphate acetyltransferase [Candidatus Hatepunaea meridiana]